MVQKIQGSKTLPFTLIIASAVVLLILISSAISSGTFQIGPLAIVLFVVTAVVTWKTWFKKNSG